MQHLNITTFFKSLKESSKIFLMHISQLNLHKPENSTSEREKTYCKISCDNWIIDARNTNKHWEWGAAREQTQSPSVGEHTRVKVGGGHRFTMGIRVIHWVRRVTMVGWEKAPGNIRGIQRAPAAATLLTRQLWEKIEVLFVVPALLKKSSWIISVIINISASIVVWSSKKQWVKSIKNVIFFRPVMLQVLENSLPSLLEQCSDKQEWIPHLFLSKKEKKKKRQF